VAYGKGRKSRKDTLICYRSYLDHAQRYRDEEGYDSLWERMIELYKGEHLESVENTEDQIVVNVSWSNVNTVVPSVTVNNPKITVSPNTVDDEDTAVITEAVTNYLWRHHNFQDQIKLAVKDAVVIGHGWVKTGWTYKEVEVGLTEPQLVEEMAQKVGEADSYAVENPELAASLPTDDEIAEHLTDTKLITKEDQPFVERISPFDIFVDPEATTLQEARWICQKIIRPIEEVRADENYKRSVRMKVEGDMYVANDRDWDREWRKRRSDDPEDQRVTIWEWWDILSNTMCVFAEGADEFLVDPHPSPFIFGHPYELLRNYDVPDYFYPMGDLEAIEPLQYELNKTRSMMMQARKKFARKYMIRSEHLTNDGRAALESDEDNQFVDVASSEPFENVVAPLPITPLPPEIYNHSEIIETDIGNVSGVSEYQRGQVPETRRTATEAAIISDALNARAADKLANVEKFIARVARRVIQLMQQYMTVDQVARVVGPEGAPFWVPYTREDIMGEFDFEVEAGSTQPMNETVRRQQAVQFTQAVAPFIQMGVADPQAVFKHLLQFGFSIKNPAKFVMQQPAVDPMTGQPMGAPPPGGEGEVPGVGGVQPPPMGDGYPDAETGESPQDLATMAQLSGQVGLGF
jgi:hypothetical protein